LVGPGWAVAPLIRLLLRKAAQRSAGSHRSRSHQTNLFTLYPFPRSVFSPSRI
jgi:hypothetical protein